MSLLNNFINTYIVTDKIRIDNELPTNEQSLPVQMVESRIAALDCFAAQHIEKQNNRLENKVRSYTKAVFSPLTILILNFVLLHIYSPVQDF